MAAEDSVLIWQISAQLGFSVARYKLARAEQNFAARSTNQRSHLPGDGVECEPVRQESLHHSQGRAQ